MLTMGWPDVMNCSIACSTIRVGCIQLKIIKKHMLLAGHTLDNTSFGSCLLLSFTRKRVDFFVSLKGGTQAFHDNDLVRTK